LKGVFDFIRPPLLPLFSNWALDFNMYFNTAHPVGASFNNARKIDSVLAAGLEAIPGGSGIMAVLAARNLRRGMAMGLPSGQAAANALGITPLSAAQIKTGLPAAEIALLDSNGGILLAKTPLWYYVLREAMVVKNGDALGPLGARIVAETFVRMLKRDSGSFMNVPGFAPSLPSSVPGQFTIADLLEFAGVLVQPPTSPADNRPRAVTVAQQHSDSGQFRGRELEWKCTHQDVLRHYQNEWVILEDEQIVAHGSNAAQVIREAKFKGIRRPYIFWLFA
jgi:hypothetical protein